MDSYLLTKILDSQLRSLNYLSVTKKTDKGDVFDVFDEFHRKRKEMEVETEEINQAIEEKKQTVEFYKTLVESYENNQYTVNLRDHHDETNMRVQAGAWGVIKCPVNSCNGRVFKQTGVCTLCNTSVCFDCMSPKEDIHTCDEEKKKSVEQLIQSAFPCPMCLTAIHKQSGCDQIFCTICHHSFDYQTGTAISRRNLHNPHFDDFLEQGDRADNEHVHWIRQNMVPTLMKDVDSSLELGETIFANARWHFHCTNNVQGIKVALKWNQLAEKETYAVKFDQEMWVTSICISTQRYIYEICIDLHQWFRRYEREIIEVAKFAPDDDVSIAEDLFMSEKIRWLTEDTEDAEDDYINKLVEAKEEKAKSLVDWITIWNVLKVFRNMDQYVKKKVEQAYDSVMLAKEGGEDMDVCMEGVKKMFCNMYDTVEKVTDPYTKALESSFFTSVKKLRDARKGTKGTNACTICFDDGMKPYRCPYCSKEVCFSCMKRWWGEDACKMQMTMPCCKRSAWGCLGIFRSKSQKDQVTGMLRRAVLEEEKAKKYKYVTFVENKRHADSLEAQIVSVNQEIVDCRSKIRDIADNRSNLRKDVVDKLMSIEYPGCLAVCFGSCPIEIPMPPCIDRDTPYKVTMEPYIPSVLFEKEHPNAEAILSTYPKEYLRERIVEYSIRLRLKFLVDKPIEFVSTSIMLQRLSDDMLGTSRPMYHDLYRARHSVQSYRSVGNMLSSGVLSTGYCLSESLRIMTDRKRKRTN